jgi:tripartite-type tricarboxylate transporter receptor subunit TctC
MKNIVAACVAGVFAVLAISSAFPQTPFPTRTVKFIVPFPGGGINDVLARIIGDKLQRWGDVIKKNNIVVD